MIRVVLRHEDDAENVLLGDFPPSEIRPLLELMGTSVIFTPDDDECRLSGTTQFVTSGPEMARRYIYEVVLKS